MRLKMSLTIYSTLIPLIIILQFVHGNNENLTDVPTDTLRVDESTFVRQAIEKLWDERKRMGYTPLTQMQMIGNKAAEFYFKDESKSVTGNLKHRFAWCLFMWGVVEGFIGPNTPIYETSSGNTATSEAYFAQLIGVPYTAVVADTTDQQKIDNIRKYNGSVIICKVADEFTLAREEAKKHNGFYMNQFANAHRAEEFHESALNQLESVNVFHEIVQQLKIIDKTSEPKYPDYFIHSAGTGGTISSVGRYIRKYRAKTQIIMTDTQYSFYFDYVINHRFTNESGASYWKAPGMAGTGFGYAGPAILGNTTSLQPSVIDRALKIPDLASTAAMHVLKGLNIEGGTSTGLNFVGSLSVAAKQKKISPLTPFRIVTIWADSSHLYQNTYFNLTWIQDKFRPHGGLPIFNCWKEVIAAAYISGDDPLVTGAKCKNPGE